MTILLVEDEAALASYLVKELKDHGHAVKHVGRGDEALADASEADYDLLIVDRMLPALDGLSLIKQLRGRKSRVPVLILSNLGGLDDRVEGLNAGADDYLCKPFAFSELLARVNALLRRPHLAPEELAVLRVSDLEMDRIGRRVTRAGKVVALQPREFGLLEYLLKHQGQMVTRTMLLSAVWRYHFDPKTHIVETHISRLRSKVGSDLIHTVRGSGYMLRENKPDA